MRLDFVKMNGAGNDFILIDDRPGQIRLDADAVQRLCHRQRGIGADGLFLLRHCTSGRADWAWEFFNSDGSTAEMCGNGARCFARFTARLTGGGDGLSFETGAGVIRARIDETHGRVTVTLTDPRAMRLNERIDVDGSDTTLHSCNTGVPHAVIYVNDADAAMVQATGRAVRMHPHFAPRGTNVNFVEVLRPNAIRVRTYERGVEGETLACGTGVTAAALVSAEVRQFVSPVRVQVAGGDWLEVAFQRRDGEYSNVQLTGPADFVFEGHIDI